MQNLTQMKKKELIIRLEETEEALWRSRLFAQMLQNTLNSHRIVPLEESAERLFRLTSPTLHANGMFHSVRESWMEKFISLIS